MRLQAIANGNTVMPNSYPQVWTRHYVEWNIEESHMSIRVVWRDEWVEIEAKQVSLGPAKA